MAITKEQTTTVLNWKDATTYRGTQLMRLVPSMLTGEGYTTTLTDSKREMSNEVIFGRDFVYSRISSILEDLNLFDEESITVFFDDATEYHIENAEQKQSSEISELIAKYGKDAIKALLK